MHNLPTVLLRPGEADRVLAGHPWIYQGAILRLTAPVEDGGIVQVKDHRQRLLGVGFYNSKSKIHVRLLSPDRLTIDRSLFADRIREALAFRRRHLPEATSFRVVNAEGDLLSGLMVDKYEDVLVLQTLALGMEQRKAEIVEVLQEIFAPRAIFERNDIASRKFEGMPERSGMLEGAADADVTIRLNGLRFHINVWSGHKTGLYLDQQVNYRLVEELVRRVPHAQVLDCFTFQGGFALHAARVEGVRVHAIDQSGDALQVAARNAAGNGLSERFSFEAANVFDWLKAQTAARPNEKLIPRFDVIILDPPSFTRNRAAVPDALRGYKEIHLRALKLLKPGGHLVTFCCSHHVDARLFEEVILASAFDARRLLRRVAVYTQSPDHPVIPTVPETEYLKGFAFEVIR